MQRFEYLDFDLVIEREGQHYQAKVVHSPGGEGNHTFTLPFSDPELENLILKLSRVRNTTRRIHSTEVQSAREFGGKLFKSVFGGEVYACLQRSLEDIYRSEGMGLRVKLRLQHAPELIDLPWEFLYDSNMDRFLGHSNQTPIVRYLELPARIRPLAVSMPLNILVMISSPADYACLDTEREKQALQGALDPLCTASVGRKALSPLDSAT